MQIASRIICIIFSMLIYTGGAAMETVLQFNPTRSQSPWNAYTSTWEEENAGKTIEAVPMKTADTAGTSYQQIPHLKKYVLDTQPFITGDPKNRRVVVNSAFFTRLHRPDVTRISKGAVEKIGTVLDSRLINDSRLLFSFLIESQLIITYVHIESKIVLKDIVDTEHEAAAVCSGSHIYFTNRKNEEPISFRISLNKKTGQLTVEGC